MKPWDTKTDAENRYTSTGNKFWRHQPQMASYRYGSNHSVISTHIAPEGACNLKCPYCSVTHRDTHNRIDIEVIKDYVRKLKRRGLKAVILTGGGEPTAYPKFNELVEWLASEDLDIALITNGTLAHRVIPQLWSLFTWVRVSINFFGKWEQRIKLPLEAKTSGARIGCSVVYTPNHESGNPFNDRMVWQQVSNVADNVGAEYIRVLPNCLLPQDDLGAAHRALDHALEASCDPRYFRQDKNHRAPSCSTCHQAYFRPYLSEEAYGTSGVPGAVYPCDSVVLNDANAKFVEKYQLCAPADILDYLDGKIAQRFDPRVDCTGCVFTDNVEMLDAWKKDGAGEWATDPIDHENFV